MTTRKQYTKEFKLDAVSLVLEQGYSPSEAARSLDITPKILSRWIKEQQQEGGQAFRGNGKLTPEQDELRRLREEVRRLTMEKDILNKPVDPQHLQMLELVKEIAVSSDYTYGSRRMKRVLNIYGFPVSRNKARKLMKEAEVAVRHRKKYK
ncbi:unnamed protein product, partial [Cyprideis torosa]